MRATSRLASGYSVAASTAALVIAVGGGALALGASSTKSITACAAKHTHVLTLAPKSGHCPHGAERVTWNEKGVAGPSGAQGAQGGQGAPGPAGTVDTSQFYDKASSDARYLSVHGTADSALDADTLDGLSSADFAGTDNGLGGDFQGTNHVSIYAEDIPAGSADQVYPVGPALHGVLTATCPDPATDTELKYTFAPATTGSLQILNTNASTDTYDDGVASSPTVTLTGVGHATFVVNYANGDVSWVDVFTVAAPGGRDTCRVRVFYDHIVGD